jgi:hypothetical protein
VKQLEQEYKYLNTMKLISISILLLTTILNVNAQNSVSKRLVKLSIPGTGNTISFKHNDKNEVIEIIEIGENINRQYTLSYYSNGALKERKLNRDKGKIKIDFSYSYDAEKISITINRSGKSQKKSVGYDDITLKENKYLTMLFSLYNKALEGKFAYDENSNLTEHTCYYGNGDVETTTYEYSDDVSPLLYMQSIPNWFWAYDFEGMDWTEGFWGKNTVKRKIMKKIDDEENEVYAVERENMNMRMPARENKTLEINYTYEYDNDGYPIKQYKDGKLIKEFFYEMIK